MNHCLLGFNGERQDGVSRSTLLGNGYRAYHPGQMRFHSPDASSPFLEGGINPYAYCLGDPVNRTDPSGHMSNGTLFGLIAGILVGGALGILTAGLSVPWTIAIDVAFTVALTGASLAIDHESPASIGPANWALMVAGSVLGPLAGRGMGKYFSPLKRGTRRWVRGPMMTSDPPRVAEAVINHGREFTQFRIIGRVPDYHTNRLVPHLNYTVEDTFYGLRRLNIVVHGEIKSSTGIGRMRLHENGMIAYRAYNWFGRHLYNFDLYDRIQLVMCYGANGNGNGFAAHFATLTGRVVQAYEGPLTIENAAIDMYICGLDTFGSPAQFRTIEPAMNEALDRFRGAEEAFWLGIRSNNGRTYFPGSPDPDAGIW